MKSRTGQELTPHIPTDDALKLTARKWTIGDGDSFPLPKFTIRCPVCGNKHVQLRLIQFIYRPEKEHPYYANVSFRCTRCGAIWNHTIPVPEQMFNLHMKNNPNTTTTYTWEDIENSFKR